MTTYACTGNPPKATPCATEIRSEKAAEDHAKTGHAVASATSSWLLRGRCARRSTMPRPTDHVAKAAVIADYKAGLSGNDAATRHGVSTSTAHKWITSAGISRSLSTAARQRAGQKRDEEFGLTGGRWVMDGLVQRWEPFIAPSILGLSDHQRRIEWEDAMFDQDEARDLHARYFNGCREDRTVVGERVYNRRKKRNQAKKDAA